MKASERINQWMKYHQYSVDEVAHKLGWHRDDVLGLLDGRLQVDFTRAEALESATGFENAVWLFGLDDDEMPRCNYAVAPGAYVMEWVDDGNGDATDIMAATGWTFQHFVRFCNGQERLSVTESEQLGQVTGIAAEALLAAESKYLWVVKRIGER